MCTMTSLLQIFNVCGNIFSVVIYLDEIVESAVLQIAIEVFVDTAAFWIEEKQGIPVIGWYFYRLSKAPAMIIFHILSILAGILFLLYTFKTTPFFLYCTEETGTVWETNACSCDPSWGFELWHTYACNASIANGTNTNNNYTHGL